MTALRVLASRGTVLTALLLLAAAVSGACEDTSTKEQAEVQATEAGVTSTQPPIAEATSTPIQATATPEGPQFGTFEDGTKIVGTDMAPGTYRTREASDGCYWARLSGFGGTLDEIIANDNTDGPTVVTIAPSDTGFESARCGEWTSDLSPISSDPSAPFGSGTFMVGVDMAPGTWRADGGSDCYWARLSGFGGTLDDIIANANGNTVVTIDPSDAGLANSMCGTWTKIQ